MVDEYWQQQQQQQHSLFSQASWGRLEMKPERPYNCITEIWGPTITFMWQHRQIKTLIKRNGRHLNTSGGLA